jgi:tripartite-type tricarboxylate transporter receptor subunit TctC
MPGRLGNVGICRWRNLTVTGVFCLLRLRVLALVGLCASAVLHTAFGQDGYPNHTIKLIVPFAAGGNGDAVGRLTAYYMQKVLDVNVVVENRPGAGGINGNRCGHQVAPRRIYAVRVQHRSDHCGTLDRSCPTIPSRILSRSV